VDISIAGNQASAFLEFLDNLNDLATLKGISYIPEFKIDNNHAGATEAVIVALEVMKTVGIELLAEIIVEFLSKHFGEGKKEKPSEKKELILKKDIVGDFELHASNYSIEELKIILPTILSSSRTLVLD